MKLLRNGDRAGGIDVTVKIRNSGTGKIDLLLRVFNRKVH